jgi:hypothetical protein
MQQMRPYRDLIAAGLEDRGDWWFDGSRNTSLVVYQIMGQSKASF